MQTSSFEFKYLSGNWKMSSWHFAITSLFICYHHFIFFIDAELALRVSEDISEAEWAVCLAHHLLGRLTVSPTYLMDSYHPGKLSSLEKCLCGCSEKVQGCYGDTSMGKKSSVRETKIAGQLKQILVEWCPINITSCILSHQQRWLPQPKYVTLW